MEHTPKLSRTCQTLTNSLFLLIAATCCSSNALADIYRFVTIDGVETFTDAPVDKGARIIIKDRQTRKSGNTKSAPPKKTHDISLDEIVSKTVTASLNPQESKQAPFEARLPDVGGTITSRVGMRIDPIDGAWRQHNGIDISIPTGTPVKAVAPGIVVYSGKRSGYGNTVIVEHDNGMVTLYAHNDRLLSSQGQLVTPDTILALSGSTGRSTGPHLHFEAWQTGNNITNAFLPDSNIKLPPTSLVARSQRVPSFRSETLSDGSILFTNIPPTGQR